MAVSVLVYLYVLILWVMVFFFKQKTAYEMRISDWSSDVCSSDLPPSELREIIGSAVRQALQIEHDGRIVEKIGCLGNLVEEPAEEVLEIGRASCRERVCQYV